MSIGRRLTASFAGIALTALAACDGVTGVGSRVEPALIIFYRDSSTIVAPDTVSRGEAFTVRIKTFGGGCTREAVRADVAIAGTLAEIRPFNRTQNANACTADLLFLYHTVQVRFDVGGRTVLRVMGEQRGASTGGTNGPALVERAIVVR